MPVPKNAIDTAVAPTAVVAQMPNFLTCDLRVADLWVCFADTGCLVHRRVDSPPARTLGRTVAVTANRGRYLDKPPRSWTSSSVARQSKCRQCARCSAVCTLTLHFFGRYSSLLDTDRTQHEVRPTGSAAPPH